MRITLAVLAFALLAPASGVAQTRDGATLVKGATVRVSFAMPQWRMAPGVWTGRLERIDHDSLHLVDGRGDSIAIARVHVRDVAVRVRLTSRERMERIGMNIGAGALIGFTYGFAIAHLMPTCPPDDRALCSPRPVQNRLMMNGIAGGGLGGAIVGTLLTTRPVWRAVSLPAPSDRVGFAPWSGGVRLALCF